MYNTYLNKLTKPKLSNEASWYKQPQVMRYHVLQVCVCPQDINA